MININKTFWIALVVLKLIFLHSFANVFGDEVTPSYLNESAVFATDDMYEERLRGILDKSAIESYDEISSMTMRSFERVYNDERLSSDGRFLLVMLWLRTHAGTDKRLLRLLKTKHAELCLNHHLLYQEDGFFTIGPNRTSAKIVTQHDLEVDHFDFSSKSGECHTLVCMQLVGANEGSKDAYTWWFHDLSVDNKSNLLFVRRVDRGWLVAPPD